MWARRRLSSYARLRDGLRKCNELLGDWEGRMRRYAALLPGVGSQGGNAGKPAGDLESHAIRDGGAYGALDLRCQRRSAPTWCAHCPGLFLRTKPRRARVRVKPPQMW